MVMSLFVFALHSNCCYGRLCFWICCRSNFWCQHFTVGNSSFGSMRSFCFGMDRAYGIRLFCNTFTIKFTTPTAIRSIATASHRFPGMKFANLHCSIKICSQFFSLRFLLQSKPLESIKFYSLQMHFDQGDPRTASFEEHSQCARRN